jgi:hypothetical protein
MKSPRFVSLFPISTLAVLLILVMVQSDAVVYAGRATTRASNRSLSAPSIGSELQSPAAKFAPAVPYFAANATFVAIGDLNGDGHSDLVAANFCGDGCGDDGVSVMLGNGDGTFQDGVNYSSGGCWYASVAIGDVNGDGKPDLVVASSFRRDQCNGPGDEGVSVLLGNGNGTFQPPAVYSSGGQGTGARLTGFVALADLNGDHHPDLVVANDGSNSVGVLLNNGDGTFQPAVNYSCGAFSARSVAIADLNGDGHPDIVAAGGGVSVLLGNGNGTFQPAVGYSSPNTVAVALGDLNGDGHPDVVVGKQAPSANDAKTFDVLLGNGDGTLQAAVSYPVAVGISWAVAIGDVNGDGDLDVMAADGAATVQNFTGQVSWALGNGDGTFRAAQHRSTGGKMSYSVAVGDVNGDGRPDLVVPNIDTTTVGVLLNVTIAATKTVVTSSLNPSRVNQPVTFTATITSKLPLPDGAIISFYNGTHSLGTAPTNNGSASLTTSFSKAKGYTIKAKYPGSSFRNPSSGTVKQVVNP